MGLYDRDYYRSEPRWRGLPPGGYSMCAWLIGVNAAVFVLQLLTQRSGAVTDWLELDPERVVGSFQLWRLVTYAFCHSPLDVWHIVGNMWFLWICGRGIEALYGPREFLRFYLAAAVFSGLCYTAFAFAIGRPDAPSLGASGAVMAVTMLCSLYYPTQEILLLFVIPVQLRWLVVLFIIFDLHPVLLEIGGGQTGDRVAHAAHLGGLLYGFLFKHFDLRFDRLLKEVRLPRWQSVVRAATRKPPAVRIYQPPRPEVDSTDLNEQVDRLLAKISEQGEASLTDAEREVLKEASRRFKRR